MSSKQIKLIAIVCGCLSVAAGLAGAQIIEAMRRQFLNTGLFTVSAREQVQFSVSLDDRRDAPAARVRLQLFDVNGAVIAHDETSLEPGQTVTLRAAGPGPMRAHAEVIEPLLQFTQRRAVIGSVEVIDVLTGVVRPTCSFDPAGLPGGRN